MSNTANSVLFEDYNAKLEKFEVYNSDGISVLGFYPIKTILAEDLGNALRKYVIESGFKYWKSYRNEFGKNILVGLRKGNRRHHKNNQVFVYISKVDDAFDFIVEDARTRTLMAEIRASNIQSAAIEFAKIAKKDVVKFHSKNTLATIYEIGGELYLFRIKPFMNDEGQNKPQNQAPMEEIYWGESQIDGSCSEIIEGIIDAADKAGILEDIPVEDGMFKLHATVNTSIYQELQDVVLKVQSGQKIRSSRTERELLLGEDGDFREVLHFSKSQIRPYNLYTNRVNFSASLFEEKWTIVSQPCSFVDAMRHMQAGCTIYCINDGLMYKAETSIGMSLNAFASAKWFYEPVELPFE